MAFRTDRGIVIRLTEFSETSQIVSLFTADAGQVRLIAKGSRRGTKTRVATGLDLLELGEFSYAPARRHAGLGTLAEWVQRGTFPGLRREMLRLYCGLYAAELVGVLTEQDDPHASLFDALLALLGELDDFEGNSQAYAAGSLVRFQMGLLIAIGYKPDLRACVTCGRPRPPRAAAYFGSAAGGLLCRDCRTAHAETRKVRGYLLDAELGTGDARGWFELLDYHLSHVAGRGFRTAGRLRKMLPSRSRAT